MWHINTNNSKNNNFYTLYKIRRHCFTVVLSLLLFQSKNYKRYSTLVFSCTQQSWNQQSDLPAMSSSSNVRQIWWQCPVVRCLCCLIIWIWWLKHVWQFAWSFVHIPFLIRTINNHCLCYTATTEPSYTAATCKIVGVSWPVKNRQWVGTLAGWDLND